MLTMAISNCKRAAPSVLTLALIAALCCSNIKCTRSESPNCAVTMTIDSSVNLSFGETERISNCLEHVGGSWMCFDLQSALNVLAELSQSLEQNTPSHFSNDSLVLLLNSTLDAINCVSLLLPSGNPHYITAPLFLGNLSVHFTGVPNLGNTTSGSMLQLPFIVCNYIVDVDPDRIFDADYKYTDYVLYFSGSEVVVFDSLEINGCPYPFRLNTVDKIRITNSTFGGFSEAVFDLYNCRSVTITTSVFHDNMGTGISRYAFRGNTGAVAIGFNGLPIEYSQPEVLIKYCNFTRNSAAASARFRTSSGALFNRAFSGRGGGLGIYLNEGFHNVSITIADSNFQSNYARSFGGGVFFIIFNDGIHHTILLQRNVFQYNVGMLGGGAIQMTFVSNGIPSIPHMLLVTDCTFVSNSGASGGAVYVYPLFEGGDGNFARFERCYFLGNHGLDGEGIEFGAALAISFTNFFRNRELLPKYEVIDCMFENNEGTNGIVSVAYGPVKFTGNNTFLGNRGTSALRIVGSLIEFYDSISFVNNFVGNVAALHFLSFGQMRLSDQLAINFWGNKGRFGASVLVDTPVTTPVFNRLTFNPQCFVIYENPNTPPSLWKNISISFRHNEAVLASALFMTNVDTCSWFSLKLPFFDPAYIKEWPIWDFGNDSVNSGFADRYSSKHHVRTAAVAISSLNSSVTVWPGRVFDLFLTGWDQFNEPTAVSARFYTTNNFTKGKPTVNIDPALVVTDSVSELGGLLSDHHALTYTVFDENLVEGDSPLATVRIDAPFEDINIMTDSFLINPLTCPPGYSLSQGDNITGLRCRCTEYTLEVLTCEDDQDTVLIQSGYWVSSESINGSRQGSQYIHTCPAGYCRCSQETSLGPTMCMFAYKISMPDAQCACNRQGVLCGECTSGLGVSSLLNNCVTCDSGFGVLIVILILLDAIVFVAIALWDKPLASWLFPFIFYCQVAPYVAQYFPDSFQIVGKFLYFVGSALSFYFPYDFCLYQSMDPLFSYFLRFFPVLTAMVLCPLLIPLRKFRLRMLDHNGLWCIVLLLYTQVLHTSLSILHCPYIETLGEYRWFVNGSVQCFSGWHAPLGLLAILMLLLCLALIPLVLIIVFHIYPRGHFYWLTILSLPLKNSYKTQWKWWFSVELGRRLLFLLFLVFLPGNSHVPLFLVCITIAIWGFVQPYESAAANILELVVLTNFLFLLMLSSTQQIVDNLSVFPPFQTSGSQGRQLVVNDTSVENTCVDGYSGVANITWLLFPFYYLPLAVLVITSTGYIFYTIRQKIMKSKQKRELTHNADGSRNSAYIPPHVRTQSVWLTRFGSRKQTHGMASGHTRFIWQKKTSNAAINMSDSEQSQQTPSTPQLVTMSTVFLVDDDITTPSVEV